MGDLLTSVVVLINGLILLFKPWYWLDPLLSVLIVAFILKNCWHILKESSAVLMNAAPRGLDIEAVKHYLEQLPEIRGVHYLHAWNLSSTGVAFSCHVLVDDQAVSSTEALAEKVVAKQYVTRNTMKLKVGEEVSPDFVSDLLAEFDFESVNFVAEPGQFAIRGGIVDVFSFSNSPNKVSEKTLSIIPLVVIIIDGLSILQGNCLLY